MSAMTYVVRYPENITMHWNQRCYVCRGLMENKDLKKKRCIFIEGKIHRYVHTICLERENFFIGSTNHNTMKIDEDQVKQIMKIAGIGPGPTITNQHATDVYTTWTVTGTTLATNAVTTGYFTT